MGVGGWEASEVSSREPSQEEDNDKEKDKNSVTHTDTDTRDLLREGGI